MSALDSRELRRVEDGQNPHEQNVPDRISHDNDSIGMWPGFLGIASSIYELRAGLVTGREKNRLL